MKLYSLLFSLILPVLLFGQVGVGTTNPDASSILDISATDKGVLVPRVSLADVSNVTTPINTPATGLLIWNTNAAVTGGNGVGFYFFNGAQWMPIQQTISSDADFYVESTTNAPTNIADDIYTQGNVAIGKNFADYRLEVSENSSTRAISVNNSSTSGTNITGIFTNVSGDSGIDTQRAIYNVLDGSDDNAKLGVYNNIASDGSGPHWGVRNDISGTGTNSTTVGTQNTISRSIGNSQTAYGVNNAIFSTISTGNKYGTSNGVSGPGATKVGTINGVSGTATNSHTGVENNISTTSNIIQYGVYNNIFSDTGNNNTNFGSFNVLSGTGTGAKVGVFSSIDTPVGGVHYGIYSDVLGAMNYAGYFRGRVAIGNYDVLNSLGTVDYYILPETRGADGQIMQTDAAGNVTWEDNVNPISSIPVYTQHDGTGYVMNNTSGADIGLMDSSIEPSLYNTSGDIQVKMVIRYVNNTAGTVNLQLRAHDGTTETYPIITADAWTFSATQTGGIATSPWKNWNAGTNAHEIHLHAWVSNNSVTILNVYLLVRSQ